MKTKFFFLFILTLFILNDVNGQTKKKSLKVVSIYKDRKFYLNGGLRASMGGQSRTDIKIDLPPKTIQWYYSFTTSPGESGTNNLNLGIQLASLITTGAGFSTVVSKVKIPNGSNAIDAFVFDEKNIQLFMAKVDNSGGRFIPFSDGQAKNTKQATCDIDEVTTGSVYLGFKNPSAMDGINVVLDVVAIIDENAIEQKGWTKEEKDNIYKALMTEYLNTNVDETIASAMSSCFTEKITNNYTVKQIQNLSKYESNKLSTELSKSCQEMLTGKKSEKQEEAERFGTLGWKAFERDDLNKCMELSKKALAIDNSLGWVKANLGLCYLIKGVQDTANLYYEDAVKAIRKTKLMSKYTFNEVIKDLERVKTKYPDLKGHEYIMDMLIYEQKR